MTFSRSVQCGRIVVIGFMFLCPAGAILHSQPAPPRATRPTQSEYILDPRHRPSAYVPVDSWIYPLLERIALARGAGNGYAGLRPWTRLQCAEILEQANLPGEDVDGEPGYAALVKEFAPEIASLKGEHRAALEWESVYSRFIGISGGSLTDSYHFGQAVINDFGRPYGEGVSNVTGFSLHTISTPIAFYVRGEYQLGPSIAAYPDQVRAAISEMDHNPIQPARPMPASNAFRLLEAYAAFNLKSVQFTIGKQSLWWGPGESGPMLMSNNAEPIYMARLSNTVPAKIPLISRFLGPVRAEFFFGELSGHRFPAAPWIHGQKLSFKPTPNLELGFSRTVIFAGRGRSLTFGSFWSSFASLDDDPSTVPGSSGDVGDRRGGFDFSYRLPKLRNWLVLYADALTEDDPSPLSAPQRAAINTGFYLTHVPGLPKLDLRAEGVYTDVSNITGYRGSFFYFNGAYHDAYTNKQNLLGSWVGRQGHGLRLSSTYWLAPRRRVQVVYRRAIVDDKFVPGGGRINEVKFDSEFELTPTLSIAGSVQFGRWRFPLLNAAPQSTTAIGWQLTYRPDMSLRRRAK